WRPWASGFTLGALAGGLTIGAGSIWMVATQHTELQLIALLLIFAVTGGAVGAFGTYLPAFYTFFSAIAVFVESIRLRLENVDLVEDLRAEKALAEEANVAKSRFLASASHDLRQPVHALSLFVSALRAHPMDTEARGLVDHIEGSVRALGGLFGGLLDISRLDAGVVDVNRVAFAIRPLIERVCRDYEGQARSKGLELRVRPTRAVAYSDPMLCERVLRNIVANAVAYTDRGKVLVG